MEKTTNNLSNLSNLPPEIQQHIAAYLDARTLGFFSISDKQRLKNILPLLLKNQIMFPLLPPSKGNSTYLFQANQLFVCGDNSYGQLGIGDNKHRSLSMLCRGQKIEVGYSRSSLVEITPSCLPKIINYGYADTMPMVSWV